MTTLIEQARAVEARLRIPHEATKEEAINTIAALCTALAKTNVALEAALNSGREICAERDALRGINAAKNEAWNTGVCPICNTEDGEMQKIRNEIEVPNITITALEAAQQDRDLHYNRCASLLFSDELKDTKVEDIRKWAAEYIDARAALEAAQAEVEWLNRVVIVKDNAVEDACKQLEAAQADAARMQFLHTSNLVDGYEWGIFRVKWKHGFAVEVLHIMADNSDLDAAIAAQEKP